jgi:hypothetical protein
MQHRACAITLARDGRALRQDANKKRQARAAIAKLGNSQ